MSVNLFDVNYYRQANPDLGGLSDSALITHFQQFGLNENRPFNRFVDLDYYRASNLDLANRGIVTNAQLYSHLSNFGLQNNRKFSRYIDLEFYRLANPDLAILTTDVDTRYEALFTHANSYALAENRRISPFFDLAYYQRVSPDLNIFTNQTQLFDHLKNFGLDEAKRKISPFEDLNFYKLANIDLLGLSNRQLFNHLEDYGIDNNRRFSPIVDIDFYLRVNQDVVRNFGNDRLQGLRHLETLGLEQGRNFSPFMKLSVYRQVNPDLAALNLPNAALLGHLMTTGLSIENRRFSISYSPSYYLENNPDLKGLPWTGETLFNHFVLSGLNENRPSSEAFNLPFYRANNADLAALNLDNKQLLSHYEGFGYKENRKVASGVPVQMIPPPRPSLSNAADLGVLTNGRNISSNQRMESFDGSQVFRFSLITPTRLSITGIPNQLIPQLIFDRNGDLAVQSDEIISTKPGTLVLGGGTYYLRINNTTVGQGVNYKLNLSPSVENSVNTEVTPGGIGQNALDLGGLATSRRVTDFVGSTNQIDYYKFLSTKNIIAIPFSGFRSSITGELALDANNNGEIDTGEIVASETSAVGVNNFTLRYAPGTNQGQKNYLIRVINPNFTANTLYTMNINFPSK